MLEDDDLATGEGLPINAPQQTNIWDQHQYLRSPLGRLLTPRLGSHPITVCVTFCVYAPSVCMSLRVCVSLCVCRFRMYPSCLRPSVCMFPLRVCPFRIYPSCVSPFRVYSEAWSWRLSFSWVFGLTNLLAERSCGRQGQNSRKNTVAVGKEFGIAEG